MTTPNAPLRRSWLVCACFTLGAFGAAMLTGCSALDPPRSVTLSAGELQRRMASAFPLDRRLLEVLDVMVSAPKLRLIPERNRIAIELEIGTRDRLFGGQWQGRIALESALRYDASEQGLRLSQVRVQQFSVDGSGSSNGSSGSMARSQAERLGGVLVERVLEGLTVYRLPPEKAAALQRAGMAPDAVAIHSRGVEITLVPVLR